VLNVLLRRNALWAGRLLGGGVEGKIDVGIGLWARGNRQNIRRREDISG
jgi:hypothetical protein